MEKAEYVDRVAIREKVCTGCTMLVDGVCCDADPCENLIAGFLEEPTADVVPAHRKENAHSVPLTLDELREMDGEPVWCEIYIKGQSSFYGIVHGENVTGFIPGDDNPSNLAITNVGAYGLAWLAYRQKPEEDDHG